MTDQEKIVKVAKALVKKFKSEDTNTLNITDYFEEEYDKKSMKYITQFVINLCGKEIVIKFPEIELGCRNYGDLTNLISKKVVELLKINTEKNLVVYKTETRYGSGLYSTSYGICNELNIVPLCKEFRLVNKKLVNLGMKPIDVKKWTCGGLFGKRSSCEVTDTHYFASSKEKCDKVLAYLKGKKKLTSVDIVESKDDDDMRRGIEYETEWYGSFHNYLKFVDSKGKTESIW